MHQVPEDKLFRRNLREHAVPVHLRFRRIQHRQLVQDRLRVQLLPDPDQRIGDNDDEKCHVPVGADDKEHGAEHQEQEVEVREDIFSQNLSDSL